MMTKEGATKMVNFMDSVAEVLMVGCGHLSLYNDYAYFSTPSIYSTLVLL